MEPLPKRTENVGEHSFSLAHDHKVRHPTLVQKRMVKTHLRTAHDDSDPGDYPFRKTEDVEASFYIPEIERGTDDPGSPFQNDAEEVAVISKLLLPSEEADVQSSIPYCPPERVKEIAACHRHILHFPPALVVQARELEKRIRKEFLLVIRGNL